MKIITSENIPIKMWLEDIEPGALQQAKNLANLPYAFRHIALMPDSHEGYGMPIGGVLAAKDVIIPNAVGVDIGCGMCAVRTSLNSIEKSALRNILTEIKKTIPLGFEHYKTKQDENLMPGSGTPDKYLHVVNEEYQSALTQIGTLGGGNHFIEVQKGSDGNIWIMIHSGSRNIGKQVADYYNKLAVKLKDKFHSPVPDKWQLAVLPLISEEGQIYLKEMNYCVDFALANRKLMMAKIKNIFLNEIPELQRVCREYGEESAFGNMINIAHNYAVQETHFSQNVMVHRKGATLAEEGTIGIIPGSQGTKSYIVKGKGEKESFNSCSHGAGRRMGRHQAIRSLDLNDEIRRLDNQGIIHSIHSRRDLDEASSAYKDIDTVIDNQKDLIEVLIELTPLGVIKG